MKKIIVSFLVSLVCFLGYAQTPYPSPNPFGSKGTMTQAQGGWKIDSTAIMPVYADTFAANRSKTSLYPGALIRVSDDYYYRSADTSKWLLLAITTSNCAGTQLISGSITWSGSGLVYDATDLDYYILCTRYFANSTTLTLSVADPTFPRIDKFYADNTGTIGVITGTPSANPQEPAINPLTQIDMGFVYIAAGSTVPSGTTQTVIYNENVEWSGTSDVPSVNFDYATNPYIGSVSTYLPNAPNSSYVEWQSNGTDYLFSDAQYLKFWVRLNANFVSEPLSFLDVTFEYTDVTVSQTLAVGNGDYNMDYSLINQWQLVSIPLTGITTFGASFNSVHFVINSAPTSFQLDYVYLLETATVPPAPVGGTWLLNGNSAINDVTQYIGTRDAKKLNFGTNGQIRAYIDTAGIELLIDDTTANVMLIDSNGKIWKTYQPTILADSPLVIYLDGNQRHIKADTTRRGAAVATQYYADSVAGAGGGGWSLLGNAGTNTVTNFIGTTDLVGLRFRTNNTNSGQINRTNFSTGFGMETLNSNTGSFNNAFGWNAGFSNTTGSENNSFGHASQYKTTTGINNNSFGYSSLYENITGSENNAFGYRSLANSVSGTMNTAMGDSSLITLTTGSRNTAIGANADVATSSTDSSVAIGYQASASTKQLAFSPYLNTMFLNLDSASGTAPSIAGIDASGNWRKYATPSGSFLPISGTGNATGNITGDLNGYQLDINNASDWNIRSTGGMGIYAEDAASSFGMTRFGGFGSPEVQMTNTYLGSGEASNITFSGSLNLSSSNASGSDSRITINSGDIAIKPPLGLLYIDTLASGAGTKALKYNPSTGAVTSSDTLAVSGVYLPIASPTFTGTLSSISGGISVGGSIVGSIGLFASGVRAGNNTNFYWNSGPAILGNTNDITFKNAAATAGANVSIGTSAAAKSAILDITSTVKGVLLPRMTSAQRDAISSPATGLTLFCTDCTATDASTGVMQTYNGSDWKNNW